LFLSALLIAFLLVAAPSSRADRERQIEEKGKAAVDKVINALGPVKHPKKKGIIKRRLGEKGEKRRERLNKQRQSLKERRKEGREAFRKKRGKVRQDLKDLMERRRETVKERREKFRKKLKERLEKRRKFFKEREGRFRERLAKIKDKRKKRVAERVDRRMNLLNRKIVDRMGNRLDRMENLLTKIESRAKKMENEGVDVGDVYTTIGGIQSDIDSLRTSLADQAGKTYTPEISDEARLRQDIGQSYQSLRSDFKKLHTNAVNIRREIAGLLQTLGSLKVE